VTRRATAVALAVFCAVASLAREASATRFALLIGNNEGQRGDTSLRFAEDDTARLSELLRRLGGFERGGTVMLLAHGADDVRGALAALAERIRATAGEHLVLVFYSGHADAQALHLGSTSLPLTELRETVAALPAATRVLILDACQAGVLTRPKGGAPGAGFEISFGKGEEAKGLAILASSSGKSCGCVKVPNLSASASVGRDGSLIVPTNTAAPGCNFDLYQHLLRQEPPR